MTMFDVPICALCEERKREGIRSVHTEKFVCDDCIRLSNAVTAKGHIIEHIRRVRV